VLVWSSAYRRSLPRPLRRSTVPDESSQLLKGALQNFSSTKSYDPAPDGKRIVALMPAEPLEEHHDRVIFLLNFFDELRRRVPLNAN
jgi:hypothetical protein